MVNIWLWNQHFIPTILCIIIIMIMFVYHEAHKMQLVQ